MARRWQLTAPLLGGAAQPPLSQVPSKYYTFIVIVLDLASITHIITAHELVLDLASSLVDYSD